MGDEEDWADETAGMTEPEKALFIAKKKHDAELERFVEEWLQQRAEEREKIEEELQELKERQARRLEERMEDEARMNEMLQLAEERRKTEEESQKRRAEEMKRRKAEERKKKQELMAGGTLMAGGDGKPNYVLPEKGEKKSDESTGIKPMGNTGETIEDFQKAKKEYLEQFLAEPPGLTDMDPTALRLRVKALHKRICQLEAVRYDMEQRLKLQEMDMKEMQERKKQKMRQLAVKKGLDPEAYAAAKHPFKVQVASSYDRQIDRRSYGERKDVYAEKLEDNKGVYRGSGRPPTDWCRTQLEEIGILRKLMEDHPNKYEEAYPDENPVLPMKPIPMKPPEEGDPPPPPPPEAAPPPAPAPAPEPEPEPEPVAAEEE